MSNKENGKFCLQATLFVGVCVFTTYTFLYLLQDKLLYQPGAPIRYIQENPRGYRSPNERMMSYSPVVLKTADNEIIHAWFMADRDPRFGEQLDLMKEDRRLVVFFHENAGNLGLRLDYFSLLYHQANCDVLAFAYRGYSASSGKPTEEGLKIDGATIMEYLDDALADHYINRGGIFVIGRSLGGAVAAQTVHNLRLEQYQAVDGLILENTFTSIPDMVDSMFSVLGYFKNFVLTNYWRTIDIVGELTLPMLYVTGRKDEIVPTEQTQRLYEASKKAQSAKIWINEDGMHNDTWYVHKEDYLAILVEFMEQSHQAGLKTRKELLEEGEPEEEEEIVHGKKRKGIVTEQGPQKPSGVQQHRPEL